MPCPRPRHCSRTQGKSSRSGWRSNKGAVPESLTRPPTQIKTPQITVLDAGGQYCHLIARKVRDLGVYSEVRPSETPARELAGRKGLIISGGPSSVYDRGSPTVDPAIFQTNQSVLGICYGQQLMAHLLGGIVEKGEKGEFGLATLELDGGP